MMQPLISSLSEIKKFFPKKSLLGSFLFFLILSSWYVLRPVRNEMAVINVDELPYLLAAGALIMLLINPVYSWIVSRGNLRKIIFYCYSFLITNLLFFLVSWKFLTFGTSAWFGKLFYVWCNVYSFFVVSIFWVVIINLYRDSYSRSFYGVIMAGGSLGALFGSEISKNFSSSFDNQGIELFSITSSILLFFAMILAMYMSSNHTRNNNENNLGGGSLDGIKNSLSDSEIRNIAIYVWLWTGLMTVQWITAINIVEEWSSDSEKRIIFFATIEQYISPLTLITQLFFTNILIKKFKIKNILIAYGFLFLIAFLLYGLFPSITIVALVTIFLRVFEYAFNKPVRENIFSALQTNDRYKSSVFIDTFISRFGDLSGAAFISMAKITSIASGLIPFVVIPLAGYLSYIGNKISTSQKVKDL